MERSRSHRRPTGVRGRSPQRASSGGNRRRPERALPPWLTLLGAILLLFFSFAFIFFVARSCVATQESREVLTYISNSKSTLSDSANLGNEQLQPELQAALANPKNADAEALRRAADETRKHYLSALNDGEVPKEFEETNHYMVSALGIRAMATKEIADAAGGDREGLGEAIGRAAEGYKESDALIRNYYVPSAREALRDAGRRRDQNYLYEPKPFMDYETLGLAGQEGGGGGSAAGDPNAPRGVNVLSAMVAGQELYAGGDVVLSGNDEPVFSVTVQNSGEVPLTGVKVEVVLNTAAERQSQTSTIERIAPDETATVRVRGFTPGQLNETAQTTITAGPVEGEENTDNNTLTGSVTFGM